MNLLAHLHLGENLPVPTAVGNLVADYCQDEGGVEFRLGIRVHREIDSFTDSHPLVAQARSLFGDGYRRFGGVLVDLAFDHCLSLDWEEWGAGSSLAEFINARLDLLCQPDSGVPKDVGMIVSRMREEGWLHRYAEIEGIGEAIARIARRRPVAVKLLGGEKQIAVHLERLRELFTDFYPALKKHVRGVTDGMWEK